MNPSLSAELRQRRPFQSPAHEATLSILRTAAVINEQLDQVLKPFGLSAVQFNVLRILRGAEPDALCRNDIRDRMLTRMPDVTRLLDRMEEAGLVRRAREGEDRRQVHTALTDAGRALLSEVDPLVEAAHQHRFSRLDPGQLRTLIDLLTEVRHPQ